MDIAGLAATLALQLGLQAAVFFLRSDDDVEFENLAESIWLERELDSERSKSFDTLMVVTKSLCHMSHNDHILFIGEDFRSNLKSCNFSLRLDSDVYTVKGNNGLGWAIEEHFAIRGEMFSTEVFEWNDQELLPMASSQKWERRKDLMGLELELITVPWSSFIIWQNTSAVKGYFGTLFTEATKELNIR